MQRGKDGEELSNYVRKSVKFMLTNKKVSNTESVYFEINVLLTPKYYKESRSSFITVSPDMINFCYHVDTDFKMKIT